MGSTAGTGSGQDGAGRGAEQGPVQPPAPDVLARQRRTAPSGEQATPRAGWQERLAPLAQEERMTPLQTPDKCGQSPSGSLPAGRWPKKFEGDFDELLNLVGDFGRFQWRLFLLLQLPFFFLAFNYFGQIWLTLEPDHWCRVPALEARGWTQQQIRNLSSPLETRSTGVKHSQCRMYDVDFGTVDPDSWAPANDTPTVACRHGWAYDFSLIYPTIVSDNDWVCDQAWKPTLAYSAFFAGSMVGTVGFSHLSDRVGRLPVLVLSNIVCGVAGFACAFVSSLPVFASLRFVAGLANNQMTTQAIVLMSEFVGPRHRAMVVNVPLATSLCGGMVIMPWIARLLYHWTYVAMAFSAPMLLTLLYYLLGVPESCRWLQHVGRVDAAVREMRAIAKENGRDVPDEVFESFTVAAKRHHDLEESQPRPSLLDALRLPRLRLRLLTITVATMATLLAFDLIARSTELDLDVYTSQSLLGLTEAPADLFTWLLLETLGRRWSMCGSMVTASGLALGLSSLLREGGRPIASTTVAFLCRCSVTVGFNVLWSQHMELVPTVIRGRACGVANVAGHACVMLSPVVLSLARVDRGLPALVLAAVALLGGLVTSTLPETSHRPLPDTLEQGDAFGHDQRFFQCFWYNPCDGGAEGKAADREMYGCDNAAAAVEE
ncbi:solute carrier family 22 member 3-like [Amphibalanus amphitrite]|uniref:solute carrier family 22 member 3-like n=1 Tax=Amphibalanus amphitrite TaxID=1232801 RepID=UPI001C90F4BD|nr:solute carrier family 22 member 3-like [Amphibalanus amphitrite]